MEPLRRSLAEEQFFRLVWRLDWRAEAGCGQAGLVMVGV